jgi:hypothetical protein
MHVRTLAFNADCAGEKIAQEEVGAEKLVLIREQDLAST